MNVNQRQFVVCVMFFGGMVRGADLITDEAARLQGLGAAFPGASVSVAEPHRPAESAKPSKGPDVAELVGFHDYLKGDPEYLVKIAPADDDETCAASDVMSRRISDERIVRFRLYSLSAFAELLIAQYAFAGANPPMACPSIARLFLLSMRDGTWRVRQTATMETVHHWSIQDIRFLRRHAGEPERVLVEPDEGGAGVQDTSLQIFELAPDHFSRVLGVTGRVSDGWNINVFKTTLDEARTDAERGKRFCFTITTFADSGRWFQPPRVAHECFNREAGQ